MKTYIDAPNLVLAAIFLKAHLKMLDAGMKNSKHSGLTILKKASAITGKPYKRAQYKAALDDIVTFIKDSTQ
jgi:hypothetical protein